MHYSAKRGIDNECRLSVCDVGGSGSHRLEILETNCVDNWPNTFARSTYSQGNIWKFWGDYRSGVGKSGVLEHKSGSISKTRKYRGKVAMEGLQERSFERYHPRPHTASPSPRLGVLNPNPQLQSQLSQERVKLRTANLAGTFKGSIRTKAH